MKIQIAEWIFDVNNYDENKVTYSKLTEEKLHSFVVGLSVENERSNEFEDIFDEYKNGKIIVSESNLEVDKTNYCAHIKCSSTSNISHYKNYTIELKECAKKEINGFIFEGITFKPYEIFQEISQGAIVINAKVIVTSEQFSIINRLQYEYKEVYFPVIRLGISDIPIQMRFGHNLWSKTENMIKMSLTLVEQTYDTDNEKYYAPAEPELSIAINQIKQLKAVNERLLDILECNKLITEEQKKSVLEELSIEELKKEQYLFNRVNDIDEWR